jgi:hypothetical protein
MELSIDPETRERIAWGAWGGAVLHRAYCLVSMARHPGGSKRGDASSPDAEAKRTQSGKRLISLSAPPEPQSAFARSLRVQSRAQVGCRSLGQRGGQQRRGKFGRVVNSTSILICWDDTFTFPRVT